MGIKENAELAKAKVAESRAKARGGVEETFPKDTVSAFGDEAVLLGKNLATLDKMKHKGYARSVAGLAQSNVFEFPVMVSDSVSLDYATAVSSLLEQVNASYLQMAISINPVIDAQKIKSNTHFSHLKTDVSKYLECADTTYQMESCHNVLADDDTVTEFNLIHINDEEASIINEAMDYVPLSEFDHFFQESSNRHKKNAPAPKQPAPQTPAPAPEPTPTPTATTGSQPRSSKGRDKNGLTQKQRSASYDRQADYENMRNQDLRNTLNDHAIDHDRKTKYEDTRNELQGKQLRDYEGDHESQSDLTKAKTDLAKEQQRSAKFKADHDADDNRRSNERHMVDMKVKSSQYLDESKIQKLNTMKPLMMVVNVRAAADDGKISDMLEYIVGVKNHVRVIDSSILPEVAKYPLKEMDNLSRKVKWRAGELKFFKDLVLKIKERKQSAIDSKDPKRKWYRRLYTIAHDGIKNKYGQTVIDPETARPNVSLIISKSDVDNVKRETGIDLLKGSTACAFCRELFLISLVVVDTDAQSIKMLVPDVNSDYEIHSIAAVNKQIALLDNSPTSTNKIFGMLK